MSEATTPSEPTRKAEQADARARPGADRDPTPAEEAAADAAASRMDEATRRSVGRHEQDMARRGVEQRGEGRIDQKEPRPGS